jgi:Ig domain of plant-specific actin-binding protein
LNIRRRLSRTFLTSAAALAALATLTAGVASAATNPVDPATMALQPSDFVSSSVQTQGYQRGSLPTYQRSFKLAFVDNRTPLLFVFSSVTVAPDAGTAALIYQDARHSFESPRTAKVLAAGIAAGAHTKHVSVKLGRGRSIGQGNDSLFLPTVVTLRIKGHKLRFAMDIALVRQDLAIGSIITLSLPRTPVAGAITKLTGDVVAHMRVGLTPHNTTPPSVGGSLTEGSTLTVATGIWTPNPTEYGYQWYRCDSTGNNCVAIVGATAETYTTTAADLGSTLKATVTATDVDGTAVAVSTAASGAIVS